MDDNFETAAAELEKSMQVEKSQADQAVSISDQITKSVKDILAKAKGGQPTDLTEEKKDSGKGLTDTKEDPAKKPVKSGEGYKETEEYIARSDDEDEDDEDEKTPAFFKKHKKKVKKSEEDEEFETEEDAVDATEFMGEMAEAVESLHKSVGDLKEGLTAFGELLVEQADPRREKLLVNMAKAITFLVSENKEIRKSLEVSANLFKAINTAPALPRVAGLPVSEAPAAVENKGTLSKSVQDRLFKAATAKLITMEEYKLAKSTGDASILEKIK